MAYAFPYFSLLQTRSFSMLILATVIGLGVIWAPTTAVLGAMFSEIFKGNVRYTGITLGYQIGAALAGGTAPLVATFPAGKIRSFLCADCALYYLHRAGVAWWR